MRTDTLEQGAPPLFFNVFALRNFLFLTAIVLMNYTLSRPSPVDFVFLAALFASFLLNQRITLNFFVYFFVIAVWTLSVWISTVSLMDDPRGKELTIALADQAFRSRRPERIADQLAYLLERHGVPRYMDWWERAALVLGGAMAHYLPSLVVPPIVTPASVTSESSIARRDDASGRERLATCVVALGKVGWSQVPSAVQLIAAEIGGLRLN